MERRFPFSIYSKMAVAMSGLIVAIVVATSWIALERTMRQYRQHMTETGILIARLIANYSLEPVVMGNYSSLRSVLAEVLDSNQDVMVIEVLDENGVPCVGASRDTTASKHPADATGVPGFSAGDGMTAAAGGTGTQGAVREPQETGADPGANAAWPEVTSPIVAYGRTWGFVKLGYSMDGFKRAIAAARFQILGVAGVSIALSLLVAGLLSRAIVTPIRKLVNHARVISRGNLDTPIEVTSRDEVGFLATTLEGMRMGLRQFVSNVARRAMGFEGDLNLFGLPAVLALVRTGTRRGGLVLERGSTAGVIYIREGEIVDAALGDRVGEEAFYEFFTWDKGTFKFSPRLVPGRVTITAEWPRLMLEGARRISDKAALEQVVHSFDFVPSRRSVAEGIAFPADTLTLRGGLLQTDEARVLALVDGRRTVRDIAGVLGVDPLTVCGVLYRLIAVGLVRGDDDTPAQNEGAVEESPGTRTELLAKVIPFPGNRMWSSHGR